MIYCVMRSPCELKFFSQISGLLRFCHMITLFANFAGLICTSGKTPLVVNILYLVVSKNVYGLLLISNLRWMIFLSCDLSCPHVR